ncbi:MAG: hypothetical protein NC412_12820 [Roseburia sp.]|nr:hypothetical protein [Roseburia sp.]MCM1279660.1 hypothetical protein [Robinsoniella sp.]
MKKKICMLALALALSATILTGCSNQEETGENNALTTGEAGELDVIPEDTEDTTADDVEAEDDAAGDDTDDAVEEDTGTADDANAEADGTDTEE